MAKKPKVLTQDRDSEYYSNVAKARWAKVKENRINKLALRFTKILNKMKGSTPEAYAHEIAKIVILEKVR